MAQIFPSLENIERLKVSPTEGERFLLQHLTDRFSSDPDVEIYFQPFLNLDRPDIILMKKNQGVTIIEAKDWNLSLYEVNEKNEWILKKENQKIKSPFEQVFRYKDNLFKLHINGLLEKWVENKNFYNLINVFVYFHGPSKEELNSLYSQLIDFSNEKISSHNKSHKNLSEEDKKKAFPAYDAKRKYLLNKRYQLRRDLSLALTEDNFKDISLPEESKINLFDVETYYEFKRHLQPPFHTLEEGKIIVYEKPQELLAASKNTHEKIKGVAGSGKTTVLAKRATNAHKRHGGNVLILTYNITLKSYVHDKISDIRENFSWNTFVITNYHQLITQTLNQQSLVIDFEKKPPNKTDSEYLDMHYANPDIFKMVVDKEIYKYETILIDEIQDYKPEWIRIIRSYFLEEDGEMVLFGDEKQNIYQHELDERKETRTPNGFGSWKKLIKPIRYKKNSNILKLVMSFQQEYFNKDYNIDENEENSNQIDLVGFGLNKIRTYSSDDLRCLSSTIIKNIKDENIHPNDATILCSQTRTLREVDYIFRKEFNEKTLTTFASKEILDGNSLDLKLKTKDLDGSKKAGFNLNSGVLKLSTIHSFKGFESPNVFLIVDERDQDEMVYSAITRAKFNIMIFLPPKSKYKEFFTSTL
jgi:hypothetical protein